jgi:hypothetical protein
VNAALLGAGRLLGPDCESDVELVGGGGADLAHPRAGPAHGATAATGGTGARGDRAMPDSEWDQVKRYRNPLARCPVVGSGGLDSEVVENYLEQHISINKNLIILCRQLQPTPQGIPIEIYAYSKVTDFEQHEQIVADIMEHIIASVIYFDLHLFEQPAGKSALD